jgi:hypothetical protein
VQLLLLLTVMQLLLQGGHHVQLCSCQPQTTNGHRLMAFGRFLDAWWPMLACGLVVLLAVPVLAAVHAAVHAGQAQMGDWLQC